MEPLLARKSDEREIAEKLEQLYDGKSIYLDEILSKETDDSKNSNIVERILKLEREATVYIERYPRLNSDGLRRNLQSSDLIFFKTFPTITRKSLLYKTKVEYGDYTVNHVFGCAHGCNYPCYAMQMSKRWGRITDMDDWMHPRIVGNALKLLDSEIPKMNGNIQFVHLSFMSDPFMYDVINERNYPQIQNLTLRIISRLNKEGIKTTVLTKGLVPKELEDDNFDKRNEYGITVVSLDKKFHQQYEPFSTPPRIRIDELEKRHDAGLKTWVSLEPYPTPNIVDQDLNNFLSEISFVDKIVFGKWNYNLEVSKYAKLKEFYKKCSDDVIEFCEANEIQYHIKNGTPRSQTETEVLFIE